MDKARISSEREKGFTLVELAIVMIIIGFLIVGVLKGQEMISNAQVTSTISQLKGIDAAASTFRDMYNAFPGDMATATTRLTNCAADPCNDGDGDGRINLNVGDAAALDNEGGYFFNHLLAADLITGLDGTATLAFGNALLSAPVGGGYFIGHSTVGVTGFTDTEMRPGHYIVLTGQTGPVASGTGILNPSQAARIDRKMDDGRPNSGSVISETDNADCRVGTVYNESDPAQLCNIGIRIQG
ncbi:MAG: prepilin-type N-terminal cleavage/methylation domain-containing protein [Alphaproteobacteria bacterium]|nr:prepilin-type N-terminal cleavage/methylation domain-containing protein [Alphaproteobacteria bacterium]